MRYGWHLGDRLRQTAPRLWRRACRRRRPLRLFWRILVVALARLCKLGSVVGWKMIVEVTRSCNGGCDASLCAMAGLSRDPRELSTAELVRTISSMGSHLFWLSITGGEPTLRADLPTVVRDVVKACKNLCVVNMPLNGTSPKNTERVVHRLVEENPELLFHFTVSIDGLGERQNRIRGRGQDARTQETWRRLRLLRERYSNMRLSVQTTISTLNLDQATSLLATYARVSDNQIVAFCLESEHYGNSGSSVAIRTKDTESTNVATAIARQYPWRVFAPSTWIIKAFLYLQVRYLRTGMNPAACAAGWSTVTLKSRGQIRPCLFLEDAEIGEAREYNYDVPSALASRAGRAVRGRTKSCRKCLVNCDALPSILQIPGNFVSAIGEARIQRKND